MKNLRKRHNRERPVEINLTDLGKPDANLGVSEEEREPSRPDIYASTIRAPRKRMRGECPTADRRAARWAERPLAGEPAAATFTMASPREARTAATARSEAAMPSLTPGCRELPSP